MRAPAVIQVAAGTDEAKKKFNPPDAAEFVIRNPPP